VKCVLSTRKSPPLPPRGASSTARSYPSPSSSTDPSAPSAVRAGPTSRSRWSRAARAVRDAMSRGPGKVERAIESAFRGDPTRTYTIEELARFACPAARTIERKHLVITRLAARRAAPRCHWIPIVWGSRGSAWNATRYVSLLDEATLMHWCGRPEEYKDDLTGWLAEYARRHKLQNRHLRWRSQIARCLVAGETEQAAQLQTQLDRDQHLWREARVRCGADYDSIVWALLNGDHALVEAAIERGDKQFRYPVEDE